MPLRHNSKVFVCNFYFNLRFMFLCFLEKSTTQSKQNALMIIKKSGLFLHPENVSAWKRIEKCKTFRNHVLSSILGIFFQKRDQTHFWNVERKNWVVREFSPSLDEHKGKFWSFKLDFYINIKNSSYSYEPYWYAVEA